MKFVLFIITFQCLLSCNTKIDTKTENVATQGDKTNKQLQENFNVFFEKFKQDTLFQVQRIDDPLSIVFTDEYEMEEEMYQSTKYVSFNQKDWDIKISYVGKKVSNDTTNVILQGLDTGIYIEHFFAKREGKWYLFRIKNSST